MRGKIAPMRNTNLLVGVSQKLVSSEKEMEKTGGKISQNFKIELFHGSWRIMPTTPMLVVKM